MSGSCNGIINITIPQTYPIFDEISIDSVSELTPTTPSRQITRICLGKNASNISVIMTCPLLTYSSSNNTIATVSQTGLVTGLKNGTVTITLTGGGKSAQITVISNVIAPSTTLTCPQRYDANHDGTVTKQEAILAVVDYFAQLINKQCAIEVVVAYFAGPNAVQYPTPVQGEPDLTALVPMFPNAYKGYMTLTDTRGKYSGIYGNTDCSTSPTGWTLSSCVNDYDSGYSTAVFTYTG